MTEPSTTVEISEARQQKLRARIEELSQELFELHKLSPDEVEEIKESLFNGMKILSEARMPFPFTQKETMAILREPMKESWLHPMVNLSHKLLAHHQVVIDPFMLTGMDEEDGVTNSVVCRCFYGTVRIKEDEIRVYTNWDRGGMCEEEVENLVAIHKSPEWLKELYPQLVVIADRQTQVGVKTYDVPVKVRIKTPEPECSGPGM